MTTQEFSDQFDTLYNNIRSDQAPGVDEYEKSVFLTKAQTQLVREYFDAVTDYTREGFDGSIKRAMDFSTLIKSTRLYNITHHWNNENLEMTQDTYQLDGIPYVLPFDYYLPVNELIIDSNNKKYSVRPLTYDEYQVKQTKPFPFPNKREAWRVITNQRGCNVGVGSCAYYDNTKAELNADITCETTFASGGKDMWFTLKCDTALSTTLNSYALDETTGVLNAGNKAILNTLLTDVDNPVDSYLQMYRTVNDPKLEQLTCSFMSGIDGADSGNDKLWDDDTSLDYTYDGITVGEETSDCIYQASGAVAITAVTVTGESSILGALKIYMKLCKELEYKTDSGEYEVGVDPYSIIACITFKHWEEGAYKTHKWVCWNGTYARKSIGMIPITTDASTTNLTIKNNSDITLKFTVHTSNGAVYQSYKLKPGKTGGITAPEGTISTIKYLGVDGTSEGVVYSSIKFGYYIGTSTPSKDSDYTNITAFAPTATGYDEDDELERQDIINVRHWDYCDLFDWPQRLKWKQCVNYTEGESAQVFTVKMTATTIPAVEIIGKFNGGIKSYMMRYIRKPKPIILEDLSSQDLSIDNYTAVTECELPEELHEEILERAITLAKLAYSGSSMTAAKANNNRE